MSIAFSYIPQSFRHIIVQNLPEKVFPLILFCVNFIYIFLERNMQLIFEFLLNCILNNPMNIRMVFDNTLIIHYKPRLRCNSVSLR